MRTLLAILSLSPLAYASAPTFAPGVQTGTLQNNSITEASGIVASRLDPGVLFTHNDSGHPAQIFAFTPAGANLATFTLSSPATNTDWEDIAQGPGPIANTHYLYLGDIGDNNVDRSSISVYRLPEPSVSPTQSPVSTTLSDWSKLTFTYPDGPHNAESLFVDPLTKDIYIITKPGSPKEVFEAPYPQSTTSTTVLTLVTTFTNPNKLTAADISDDGSKILIRSDNADTGLMYIRPPGDTIAQTFATTPIPIPLATELQGEAIGFDSNNAGYYTTSEGQNAPIFYFAQLPEPSPTLFLAACTLALPLLRRPRRA